MARAMLDEAGLTDCGIVLSNDLDEFTIQSIRDEGAQVTSWGVGTKLACAYDQPTLGGVYKLSATRASGESEWTDRLKISESAAKLTTPGVLVEHGVDHVDEGLVGAPDTVTTGQQVGLEEAFHLVLGQLLDDLRQ